MSKTLRRPMFRGGRVSSYGTGIAHGLADGGMPPKRGLVDGPGGYAGDWNWKGGSTGGSNIRTGGEILKKAMTPFQEGLYGQNVKMPNWMSKVGNWLKPGRIAGLASRTGLGTLPFLYAGGAKLLQESLPEELQDEGGIYDRTGGWGAMGAGADIAGTGIDEVLAGEVDMTKYEHADKTVTGIKGPAGIEPISSSPIEVNPNTGEAAEPVELTAKEMVREKKELFMDLLGADKAKGQDISEMLLGFAGAEGDTTWEKSKAFFRDEAKRPSKLQKIEETAGVLAINDYIAGKRSKENLEQTLGMKKSIIDYDYATKSQIINVTETDSFRSGLGKIAAKYKLDPTSASALKAYFAEVLGLKLYQPKNSSFSLEKFEKREWKDLKVGFNLVSPEGEGKIIIEKKPDGSIDIKEKLVI